MDIKKNEVLPWAAFAVTVLFAVSNLVMSIALDIDTSANTQLYLMASTVVSAIAAITLLLITGRINRIYDPMEECAEAVSSRYAFFAVLMGVIPLIYQIAFFKFIPGAQRFTKDHLALVSLMMTALSIYLTGFPLLSLSLKNVPKMKIEKRRPQLTFMLLCVCVMCGLSLVGVLLGTPIDMLLTRPFEGEEDELSAIQQILSSSTFAERVLIIGIIGPLFEELIFRKLLVERTIRYGETFSIILSGVSFGLFHGNFQQFFFTSLVGMLFAFVFIRTGSVIYPALLHMTMNLSTSIVTVSLYKPLLPYMDVIENIEGLPDDILLILYGLTLWMMFLGALAVTGICLFFVFRKRFTPYKAPGEPSTGKIIGSMVKSPMFWSFAAVCIADFGSAYLPNIIKSFM